MAGEDAAKAAEKPAEAPEAAKELERLEEDDEFEEFETEGASCQPGAWPAAAEPRRPRRRMPARVAWPVR
jgi:hypothetical protein